MPRASLSDIAASDQPAGLLTPGNIDLTNRPQVKNPDGSVSTVRSISVNVGGDEVLIPTVVNGRVVSDQEAVDEYKRTRKHLGIFDTPSNATAYAKQLHESEAKRVAAGPATGGVAKLSDIAEEPSDGKPPTSAIGWNGPLNSIVSPEARAGVVSRVLGHEVAPKPEQNNLDELKKQFGESPVSTTAKTVFGLTGIPSIYELLKTGVETVPDILTNLGTVPYVKGNPGAVVRGGAAGLAEGVMEQATPANIVTSLLPFLKSRLRAGGTGGTVTSEMLKEMPLYKQMEHLPTEPPRTTPPPQPTVVRPAAGKMSEQRIAPQQPPQAAPIPGGRVQTPPVSPTENFNDLPLYKQMEFMGNEPGGPIEAGGRTGMPRVSGQPEVMHDAIEVPAGEEFQPGNTSKLPPKQKAPDTRPPVKAVEESINQAHVEADKTVAETGNVEQAAQTIEGKVKLSVSQLAQKMRDQYGSKRAGKMLQPNEPARVGAETIKRLAPGESKMPQFAIDDMAARGTPADQFQAQMDKIGKGQKGEINPMLAAAAGGAGTGAAIGAAYNDDDRATGALVGGTAGALVVPLLAHAVASGSPMKATQNFMFSAALSRPGSVLRAYLGGIGGAMAAGTEKLLVGDPAGAKIIGSLFSSGFVKGILTAIRDPKTSAMGGEGFGAELPTITGRIYDGVNEPAMRAMMAGGLSREEAMRYTLAGTPRTPLGNNIIQLWNKYFVLKMLGSMFPRVGIQTLEMGLERTPAGLIPPRLLPESMAGLNEGTAGERAARAAVGTGTALAAYMGAKHVEDWARPYLDALSGVYGLGVPSALAAGQQAARGKSGAQQASAAVEEATQNLPFPRYGPTEAAKQVLSGASFVPGIVDDVARARDPYDRKTAGGWFDRTKKKIPGLRETLPVRGQNVNIAGEPTEDRSSAVTRFFTRPSANEDPMHGVPENVTGELKRLGVQINAPSFEQTANVGKRKIAVPPDVAERARSERRQYLLPQIEKIISSPNYASSNDAQKKRKLEAVIKRAEAAGSQRARMNVMKSLRDAGALRR